MNFIRIIAVVLALSLTVSVYSQPSFIDPYKIEISSNKTTHVLFPFPIKSVDRGSLDVLAQRSPGADAVLQLKADHPRIPPTNVTVITADNKLYSFLVVYDSMPQHLTLSFDSNSIFFNNQTHINTSNTAKLTNGERPDQGTLQATAKIVMGKKKKEFLLQDSHERMSIRLTAIYIKNDVYYFSFRVSDRSNVSFSLQSISFTIKDTKKVKRKASQEKAIEPLFQYATEETVREHEQRKWVVALPKFTLEDNKHLQIQILEQDGGRNLSIQVQNKHLLSARKL